MESSNQRGWPDREQALEALRRAGQSNPGRWVEHSRYVAQACEAIAGGCPRMNREKAYVLGILHDIGRFAGVSSEKHLIDGWRYCKERGWDKAAQICVSHAFMIQDIESSIGEFDMTEEEYELLKRIVDSAVYDDYDLLVQLCDSLALPEGFCLLEKRFVDVALRYGTKPVLAQRWKRTLEIKSYFEEKMGGGIYGVLPGCVENTFR